MNYKKRDDELIKLNKQARAKANIGNNSGNVGYTENAFRSRKKLPELQNSPNKATTQANNLTNKGFSGSKSSNAIDFDYVLKNDKYWGNKGMSVGALDIDSDYRRKMGRTENAEDNAKYYQRFGMSRNEVLDQYDKYKRETHPIRTAFEEDFRSAQDRAVTGALGSLAHLAFPHSDLDKMANSDFVQRKNREVQRGRDYVQDSNKLTDTQKAIARGVESGGDFLTNMATAGVLGGGGAIADVASGVGTMIQPAKWVSPFLNGLFNYGSTSQEVKHDLERQGLDSDTAYNMGNASGAISGAAGALMMGTGGKAASTGANWLMKALSEGGRIGGISLGQQGLQEIANQLILDNQSTFNNDVQRYVAQGYTEEDAANQAAANVLGRVGSAGATGFLGGAGFSLLGSGLSKLANRTTQGVPSAGPSAGPNAEYNGGFNEYAQPSNNRPLLTQVDALPDNGTPIPSIEGMMTLGLPKKQLPSDAIRMPGTQGVINLPGQTEPIYLPDLRGQIENLPLTDVSPKNPTLAPLTDLEPKELTQLPYKVSEETSLSNNPRIVEPLTEEQRAIAQSNLDVIRTEKGLMQKELDGYKNKKRLTKDEKARRDLLKDRIKEHTKEETRLTNQLNGKAMSVKDLLKSENYDAYNSIFNWKGDESTFAKIDNIVKFAGNTPEAKQLGKQIKQSLENLLETGDVGAFAGSGWDKAVYSLDSMAKEANIIPFGDLSYADRYGDIWDFLADDSSKIGNLAREMNDKYPMPQAETPVPTGESVQNTNLVPQLEPNFTLVDAPKNPMFDLDLQFFTQGKQPNGGYWLRLLGDSDFLQQEAQKNNVTPEVLRQYANYNLGYDETNAPKQEAKPDNSYWTKVLSDDSFLQLEAQKHNVTPDVLRDYANMNLGNTTNNGGGKRRSFFDNNNMPGGNVPPNNNGGNNVPPNNGRPINLTQDENGNVVESGTSRHIRGEDTPLKVQGVSDEVIDDFTKDPTMYKQLKNKDTLALANAIYNSGDTPVALNGKTYQGNAEEKFRVLLGEKNPAALPLGNKIAQDYSAQGKHDLAAQIYRDMDHSLTEAGQFTQAAVISMMKNDPMTALSYMEKELRDLNKNGREKYGNRWNDFELTDDEKKLFDNIRPGDTNAIQAAFDKVGARIEREYPVSMWEKVLEFRRVAMLFNSRTIMRNMFANVPTAGMRYVADRIEGVGQYVAHLINPEMQIDQAIRGADLRSRRMAIQVYDSDRIQNRFNNLTGRVSEMPKVGDYARRKQIFKGGPVSNFINDHTNHGIERLNARLGRANSPSIMELGRGAAYGALEITDRPFVRENFISRLGSYIRAAGITDANDIPDEALNVAFEEALKATYKDNSWLVQAIKNAKGSIETIGNNVIPRLGDAASQALIPYVQAPGNIGARIVDYSPVGVAKGIADIVRGARSGDPNTIKKGIEEASKGASGTLIAGLGMALAAAGVITGAESDDPDQRAFEKRNGFREFAIRYNLGGKTRYDTIDWAQPFVDSLMFGVLLQQAIDKTDKYDSDILRYFGHEGTTAGKGIGIAKKATSNAVNYFFNATPLQNLADLFKSKGQETDIAANIKENTIDDFAGGLIPSAVNSVAKTIDTTRRQTYDPSNQFGTFVNTLKAKVPFLSRTLPIKYDTWGDPMNYGDNVAEAGFAKMLYPGEHTTDTSEALDDEITRLFNATKDATVYPQVAPYKVDGEPLTAKELSDYQKRMGSLSKDFANTLINMEGYQDLEDSTKVETLANLYGVAKAITENELRDKPYSDKYKKAASIYEASGVEGTVSYLFSKKALNNADISSSTNAAKEIEAAYLEGNTKEAEQLTQKAIKDNAERIKINEEYGTDIKLGDYQKREESQAGSNKQWAANKAKENSTKPQTTNKTATTTKAAQTTNKVPEVKADTAKEQKYVDRAGKQSRKYTNDIPKIESLNFSSSQKYTYAYAINQDTSLTPEKFDQQYDKMDLDKNGSMKQDEMITYFNNSNVSEKEGQYLWRTYGENKGKPWKTVPKLSNGKWKK